MDDNMKNYLKIINRNNKILLNRKLYKGAIYE